MPLRHAAAAVACCPFFSSHALDPLHVEAVVQSVCGSVLTRAGEQVPLAPPGACFAAEQAWHVGQVAVPQQTPSTQDKLPVHSWQFAPRQSPPPDPAARLHVAPWALSG